MKKITTIVLLFTFAFTGCVGDDFINDRVDERIAINNPINEIQVNNTYQLNATFFNNIGQEAQTSLTWVSSNPSIASVSNQGLLTAISQGTSTIRVSAVGENGTNITAEKTITIVPGPVDNTGPITKSGMIVTTSSYTLTGNFTISEIQNSNDLDLQVESNYQASSSLPGLYLYLSNNPNSVSGAYEVGAVQVFSGAHSYTIPQTAISDYKYLLYWCKPFSVKVGHGEIND